MKLVDRGDNGEGYHGVELSARLYSAVHAFADDVGCAFTYWYWTQGEGDA